MKLLLSCLFIILVSCSKDEQPLPPGDNNLVTAMIDTSGTVFSFNSNDNIFDKTVDQYGDSVINVIGSLNSSQIRIVIININDTGSYQFGDQGGDKGIILTYADMNLAGPLFFYQRDYDIQSGLLVIDSLSDNYISGTFRDTLYDGTKTAVITGGVFKGNFD